MTLVPLMYLITVALAQAMISAFDSYKNIFQNTAGIVFLGTPHQGSSLADRASLLFRLIRRRRPPPLLDLLSAKSSLLNQIAGRFNSIWGSRHIFSFRETKVMFNWKIVIHHSMFLQHLSHQLLLSDCPQGKCDHKLRKRVNI